MLEYLPATCFQVVTRSNYARWVLRDPCVEEFSDLPLVRTSVSLCENYASNESLNVDSCARIVLSTRLAPGCLFSGGFPQDLSFLSGLPRSYLYCFHERVHSRVSSTTTTFRFNLWVQLYSPICGLGPRTLTATIQIILFPASTICEML